MTRSIIVFAIAVFATSLPSFAQERSRKIILIKADDVRSNTAKWERFFILSGEKGVKVSAGIVCNSLRGDQKEYFDWLNKLNATGSVEFWNHGWDHKAWTRADGKKVFEFSGSGYEHQKKHFDDSQQLMKKVLGVTPVAFGTPYNAVDADTVKVMNEDAGLRLFFGKRIAGLDNKVVAPMSLRGESDGTGKPNFEKFEAAYVKKKEVSFSALQFHPNSFNDAHFAEYARILDFLIAEGWTFMLPAEYVAMEEHATRTKAAGKKPPNILFAIADDWGAHAGAYGDKVVKTPIFDRLAKEGVLFEHAYISSPSCAPSRAAIVTGQWHWRLDAAANLYGSIPLKHPVYPDLLEAAGYFVGYTRKGWGPGSNGKRRRNPAGNQFKDFKEFLEKRPKDKPFCFWFGSNDPHRGYKLGSGAESGIPLDKIDVPACFPDSPEVRGDVADYYFEVQRFDRETGEHIEQIRALGELDNTIVVMTSDHGMPFPRCKSNIYDDGAHVPLAIHWPGHYEGGHRVTDYVSSTDYAPTFLTSAGLPVPEIMTGRSLIPQLTAGKGGRIQKLRSHILFGKERHVPSQAAPDSGGYPCRAIRTDGFLLVRNFRPDRWPNGTEDYKNAFIPNAWLADTDNGPTKTYMVENRDKDAEHRKLFDLSFAKRPEYELFDVRKDPNEQINLAYNPEYADVLKKLSKQLNDELEATGDPRVVGGGEKFDAYPYGGGAPLHPNAPPKKRRPKKK